jgi:branched-chain amino acid transport system permease protein
VPGRPPGRARGGARRHGLTVSVFSLDAFWQQGVAGIAFGAIIALSASGLVLTYRATGIFNFAHGAVAMFVAYIYWQSVDQWHLPAVPVAVVCTLLVGPAIGLALERLVFRPLQRGGAGTADQLVATLGVFVLLVGVATIVWGLGSKVNVTSVFPDGAVHLPDQAILSDAAIGIVAIVAATSLLLQAGLTRTRLGRQVRAVVDRRDLAELAAVDADRVSALSWAVGCGFAGLTGILLAPTQNLNTYNLTLAVVETFVAAAIARLSSLPRAVTAGLVLGIASSELQGLQLTGSIATVVRAVQPNLLVIGLLVTLLVYKRLDLVGEQRASGSTTLAARTMGRRGQRSAARIVLGLAVAATAAFGPLYLQGDDTRLAQQAVGLAIIFLSIVAVTGYSGQISLGQSGFAGLGALVTGSLSSGVFFGGRAPVLVAMLVAVLVCFAIGGLVGFPALRRQGLFLALTTLAVAEVIYQLLLTQDNVVRGVRMPRPDLLGWHVYGDDAFYLFELVLLAAVLLLVRNLRSGRLGRALGAMRDSEDGARAVGLSLRRYKLFIFAVSAGIAAVGGTLYEQAGIFVPGGRGFSGDDFQPIQGLFFFVAVVVAGSGSAVGAVLAAAATLAIDAGLGTGTSTIFIGAIAVVLGRLPGGLAYQLRARGRQALDWFSAPEKAPPPEPAPLVLTARGVRARASALAGRSR